MEYKSWEDETGIPFLRLPDDSSDDFFGPVSEPQVSFTMAPHFWIYHVPF